MNKQLPKCSGQFFSYELMSNEAFWKLTGNEMRVLFVFHCKTQKVGKKDPQKRHLPLGTIKNNGKLVFTYCEAKKFGIPKSTFTRCIDKLITLGFVDVAERGTGYSPNTYSLSDRWQKFGSPDFEKSHRIKYPQYAIGFNTRMKNKTQKTPSKVVLK
jgi:hypothetical protein